MISVVSAKWALVCFIMAGTLVLPGAPLQPAWADEGSTHSDRRDVVANKLRLLESLITKSPAVSRIEQSTDESAKRLLQSAQSAYQAAREKSQANQYADAERFTDEGLRHISVASQRVTDRQHRAAAERSRHNALRSRVVSFREAFDRVREEKRDEAIERLLDVEKVDALFLESERLAKTHDYAASNQKLDQVAAMIEYALVEARHQETLIHELKFESPDQEYAYEKQRNLSHELLIDILVRNETLPQSMHGVVEQVLDRNNALRVKAQALAESGDVQAAIDQLEEATNYLGRVLRTAGMGFP